MKKACKLLSQSGLEGDAGCYRVGEYASLLQFVIVQPEASRQAFPMLRPADAQQRDDV